METEKRQNGIIRNTDRLVQQGGNFCGKSEKILNRPKLQNILLFVRGAVLSSASSKEDGTHDCFLPLTWYSQGGVRKEL